MEPRNKGKGKDQSQGDAPEEQTSSPSFLERVGNSASGLIRDTIGSNGPHVNAGISAALDSSNKAGSSSTAVVSNAQTHQAIFGQAPSLGHAPLPANVNSFRSQPAEAPSDNFSLEQWSSAGLRDDHLQQPYADPSIGIHNDRSSATEITAIRDQASATVANDNQVHHPDQVHSTNPRDGAEVVQLLSDSSFQPEFWEEADLEDDVQPFTITSEERDLADRFNQAISSEKPTSILLTPANHSDRAVASQSTLATRFESSLSVDSSNGSNQQLLGFFDDVQNYHEDVWGILGTLVQEARTELGQGQTATQSPAVARLRMILGHINPSKVVS